MCTHNLIQCKINSFKLHGIFALQQIKEMEKGLKTRTVAHKRLLNLQNNLGVYQPRIQKNQFCLRFVLKGLSCLSQGGVLGAPQVGTLALFNGLILSGSDAVLKQSNWKTDSRVLKRERCLLRKAGQGSQTDSSPKPVKWVERLAVTAVLLRCTAHAISPKCQKLVFPLGFFCFGFFYYTPK